MSNFKSGSGNLDFGSSGDDDENDDTASTPEETQSTDEGEGPTSRTEPESATPNGSSDETERPSEPSSSDQNSEESAEKMPSSDEYPYFVRRSNVGDERDTRLEIHVRDKVADQEAEFRSGLAEQLDANEIAKTDAREFALLAAFQCPERVAELMRNEGFGTLD